MDLDFDMSTVLCSCSFLDAILDVKKIFANAPDSRELDFHKGRLSIFDDLEHMVAFNLMFCQFQALQPRRGADHRSPLTGHCDSL